MKTYYVYILSNISKTLYIGVTNNIVQRVFQHKSKLNNGFSHKYNITHLVYYEEFGNVGEAIAREKQLKNWHRNWKINLIESKNKDWNDLAGEWYDTWHFDKKQIDDLQALKDRC